MRGYRGVHRRLGVVPLAVAGAAVVALAGCSSGGNHAVVATTTVAPATTVAPVTTTATGMAPTAGGMADAPCGTLGVPPPVYDHVIWIWMENHSFSSVIGSDGAPFETQLARRCGLATNYRGIGHPSLPNYIAAVAGSTLGITDDGSPSSHPLTQPSLFQQITSAGATWKTYAEGMPAPCTQASSGRYAVRHNPAVYFTTIRADCAKRDVPLGTLTAGALRADVDAGALPAFSLVIPDLCDDTHDCPVRAGDGWLQGWVTAITGAPSYRDGRTALIITWDEGDSADNRVPTIVVAPSVPSGTTVAAPFDHYSLLRTTEELLGLSDHLGYAGTAPSMRDPFHL